MWTALASGVLLGLSCGLAPGPLMTLVVAQTLRHGRGEGCKIALAPLITDAPIIVVAVAVAARASEMRTALGVLSIAGALFVLYLAVETFRPAPVEAETTNGGPRSLSKGVLTNLLNPNPWLFWMTIGAASLARAAAASWWVAALFLGLFYVLLVGSKVMLALLAGSSRAFLTGRPYRMVLQGLAVLLVAFATLLLREGLSYLALI